VAALVAAAMRLFGERGPGAVSLREVAAEAGVNYGLIHQYVGTKDDLLALVMRSSSAQTAARFAEDPDAATTMARLMPGTTASSAYARMLAWALLEGHDAGQLLGRSPALRELTDALHRARLRDDAAGRGDDDLDERVRVAAAVALSLGWNLFGSFVRQAAALDELDAGEATARIRRLGEQLIDGSPATTAEADGPAP
jgi:AcrR family transcriptional regulator